MAHDVFISYSTQDKSVADAMCHHLEARHIRCWVAPRDVAPGANFAGSIVKAIRESRVMVLVYSESSNRSPHVLNEVNAAVAKGVMIIPFRIEDAALSEDMEYYLGAPHWLDALTEPIEVHLDRLCDRIDALLVTFPKTAHDTAGPANPKPATAQPAAPQKPADPLAMKLQEIRQEQAKALAAVRTKLAEEIERRAFAQARETVAQLLALQPNDADAHAAKAFIERELEAEGKRRAEEARLAQEAEARRRREQEQRKAEELRLQEMARREAEERKRQTIARLEAEERKRQAAAQREAENREQRENARIEAEERKKKDEVAALHQRLKVQLAQGSYTEALATAATLDRVDPYSWDARRGREKAEWNLAQQKLLARFSVRIHDLLVPNFDAAYGITCLAVFPNEARIVSGDEDGHLNVCNAISQATLYTLNGHVGPISAVTVSATGRYVVSGGEDGHIAVWNIEAARCVRVLFDRSTRIHSLALLAGGDRLVAASQNELVLWDLASGEMLHRINAGKPINCLSLLPNGLDPVSATDSSVDIWDLEMGINLGTSVKAKEMPGGAQYLVVLQNGRLILSGSRPPGVTWVSVRDLATGRELQHAQGLNETFTCAAATPDGSYIVYGTNNGSLVVWDLQRAKIRNSMKCRNEAITCVAAYPAGGGFCVVAGSTDGSARVWNPIE